MARKRRTQNLIAGGFLAVVASVVAVANWQASRRGRENTAALPPGTAGAALTSREGLEQRVRVLEARVAAHPDDTGAALGLADALLRQTRVAGNPGLARQAEQVLKRVHRDDPSGYDVNRLLGALYLSQHRFREAIAIGEKNKAARPFDPVNDGVIGDGHLELGEYDEAFDAFDRMMRLRPSAAAYARVAYARELQGNLNGAVKAMTLAAAATPAEDLEGLAWAHAQLGDLQFQLGHLHDARREYARASQAFPGHPFAVIGYARVTAAEGDSAGALTLLQNLAARTPTPDVRAQMGDLLERLGRHDDAVRQFALAEAAWREDAPDPKNLARFLADHGRPDEAVRVAEDAARQRQDIFTTDALAWAYFKDGRLADARAALARALRTGSRDRVIQAHAAAIRTAAPRMALR